MSEQGSSNLRILVVSENPLTPELGAAQMALNLTDAFRDLGAEVTLWQLPVRARQSWHPRPYKFWERALEHFVSESGPFDLIDAPAQVLGKNVALRSYCVARSVQPQLRYLWQDLLDSKFGTLQGLFWTMRNDLAAVYELRRLIKGWNLAKTILCLGELEYDWMKRNLPWLRPKLSFYHNALNDCERVALEEVRRSRFSRNPSHGIRFLWIGRWVRHKGRDRLVDFISHRLKRNEIDTFVIAGCGSTAANSINQFFGRDPRVHAIPYFSRQELPGLLLGSDVGLFTSICEGWGLSINEMVESGLPVFATDAGGISEISRYIPNMIFQFPPPDNWSMASVEVDLSADAFTQYHDVFSWRSIAKSYLNDILPHLNVQKGFD